MAMVKDSPLLRSIDFFCHCWECVFYERGGSGEDAMKMEEEGIKEVNGRKGGGKEEERTRVKEQEREKKRKEERKADNLSEILFFFGERVPLFILFYIFSYSSRVQHTSLFIADHPSLSRTPLYFCPCCIGAKRRQG